jgi:hypothetical protein
MRKKFLFAAAPLAALLLSDMAMAATTANLTITGRILPPICDISLTGGGAINYGTINSSSLKSADNTVITPNMSGTQATTTMNITCDAPAQIAVTATDNRAATVNPDVLTGTTVLARTAAQVFGMGADSKGVNIGAFSITGAAANSVVDGAVGKLIDSPDGTTWTASAGTFSNVANSLMSWTSASGTTAPEPVTSVAQTLTVDAATIARSGLDTSVPVNLDGSVTFELKYL